MVEDKFSSINELYNRILPALRTKKNELRRNKINYIYENNIWDYLRENIWISKDNLTLYDIVNDILTVNEKDLIIYMGGQNEGNY